MVIFRYEYRELTVHNHRMKTVALLLPGLILIITAIGAVCAGANTTAEGGISRAMLLTAAVYLAFTSALAAVSKKDGFNQIEKQVKFNWLPFVIIFAGLAIRLLIGYMVTGYATDMACWTAWSQAAAGKGIFGIYTSGIFIDYPPGYVYVLHLLGSIANLLGMEGFTPEYNLLVKLPSIIADMVLVYIIYSAASKRFNTKTGSMLALFYAINPLVILDSAGWGQVDGLLTLLVVLYLTALNKKKIVKASVIFTIGMLVKPQMIFFGPVLAVVFIKHIMNFGIRRGAVVFAKGCGLSVALFIAAVLPFSSGQRWTWIFEKYFGAVGSYNFITLNSANIYGMLGMNWRDLTVKPEGVTLYIVAIAAMILSVAVYFALSFLDKKDSNLFMLSAILMAGIFVLGPKMHERYIFPVAAVLLFSYIYEGNILGLSLSGMFSAAAFINSAQVLSVIYIPEKDPIFIMTSLIMTLLYLVMTALCASEIIRNRKRGKPASHDV